MYLDTCAASCEDIEKKQKELEAINNQKPGEEKVRIESRVNTLEEEKGKLTNLKEDIDDYNKEVGKLPGLQLKAKEAEEKRKNASKQYEDKYHLFIAEQAGYLAEELQEDQPCPVCGSTHHPQLAQKAPKAPTKAELETEKEEVERLQKLSENAANDYSKKVSGLESTKETLLPRIKELLGDCEFENAITKIESRHEEIKKEKEALNEKVKDWGKLIKRQETLNEELPKDRNKLDELTQKKSNLESAKTGLTTSKKNLENHIEELKKELKYPSEDEAKKALKEKKDKKDELEGAITLAENKMADYRTNLAELNGTIIQLAEQIKVVPNVNVEEATQQKVALENEKREKVDHAIQALNTNNTINEGIIKNVNRTLSALSALEEEYQMKKTLSDTANGQLTGKERISLETDVQSAYFERIIQRANTRLMVMSNGQYELRRRTTSKGSAQTGLELNALDHYNGTERDIRSLSGGEQFKDPCHSRLASPTRYKSRQVASNSIPCSLTKVSDPSMRTPSSKLSRHSTN